MSKIYEALLQAEIDRVATANQSSAASPQPAAETAAETQVPPAPQTMPVSPFRPSTIAPLAEPAVVPEPERARVYSPSDFAAASAAIPAYPWKLMLKQLPSTEERGSAVEQFRSLRSRMFEFRAMAPMKTVMISSGLPEEGKSFIAINLAISLARHKSSRVLLIDGDMRRGTMHKLLGAPSAPGLTEYLSGQAMIGQVMQRAKPNEDGTALPPGIESLHFIACGRDADNAADLSGNTRFMQLIQEVSPRYDWIIVDSSPVNLIADGINLARSCDAVLLVTRGEVTKFQVAQRALQELKASNVIGVVLNAVHKLPTAAGYYGYDAYESVKE